MIGAAAGTRAALAQCMRPPSKPVTVLNRTPRHLLRAEDPLKTLILTGDRNLSAELSELALLEASGSMSIRNGDLSGRTSMLATSLWSMDVPILRRPAIGALLLPVLIVADQSALVAIGERWCVDDVVVPGLSPAGLSRSSGCAVYGERVACQ